MQLPCANYLKYDARRDLDDLGATCAEVHALNKLPYSKLDSKSVGIKGGVVFLTCNSLIASSENGRSRLQQLVQWCGPGFDGLVIFVECHKAKNLVPEAGSQPTRIGQAVVDIQLLVQLNHETWVIWSDWVFGELEQVSASLLNF